MYLYTETLLEEELKSDSYKIKENWLQWYQNCEEAKTQIIYNFDAIAGASCPDFGIEIG